MSGSCATPPGDTPGVDTPFAAACLRGDVRAARSLARQADADAPAELLARLVAALESVPAGVAAGGRGCGRHTDEASSTSSSDRDSDDRNRPSFARLQAPPQLGLRKALLACLRVAAKRCGATASAAAAPRGPALTALLVRVLESPRLHYDLNFDIARLLLRHAGMTQADILAPSPRSGGGGGGGGRTPLHAAATSGVFELSWLLVKHGAASGLALRDEHGRTPAQVAGLCEHIAVADYLLALDRRDEHD